ncbi:hypothetical protein F5Y19DRAFT_444109 [Xylariaceae sp. FL1651]|nr:hypothetical protein F5Y19DRAFT_444109 [Xylariaceae sp. FL1651]
MHLFLRDFLELQRALRGKGHNIHPPLIRTRRVHLPPLSGLLLFFLSAFVIINFNTVSRPTFNAQSNWAIIISHLPLRGGCISTILILTALSTAALVEF